MKLEELSEFELKNLERTIAYLIDSYGNITLDNLQDKILGILQPEEKGEKQQ